MNPAKLVERTPGALSGLSARLLALTVAFVMLAEFLIYSPSIALFWRDWLQERLAAAMLAAHPVEATAELDDAGVRQLLDLVGAHSIIVSPWGGEDAEFSLQRSPRPGVLIDLRAAGALELVQGAYATLLGDGQRVLQVTGLSPRPQMAVIEVVLDEQPLRQEMIEYSWGVLRVSLAISFFTAALIYLALQWMIVRPLRRLSANMTAFGHAPEDPANLIGATPRGDEIGAAQRGLAAMEDAVRSSLRQRAHLAALGSAVAKISHDLRGVLASVQLLTDRFAGSSDPQVRKLAPRLMASIDRAVALCSQTLDFARDNPPAPRLSRFALSGLLDEVESVVAVVAGGHALWIFDASPDLEIVADRGQLFRVLVNLGRNAVEAGACNVRITANVDRLGAVAIEVADDGPGVPAAMRERLFTPFAGSARAGGSGLGLAIARELVRGHGGDLRLVASTESGAVFRLELPGVATLSSDAAA